MNSKLTDALLSGDGLSVTIAGAILAAAAGDESLWLKYD